MRKQFNLNSTLMSTVTAAGVSRGSAVRWFEPLATQRMSLNEWLEWIGKEEATRQDGTTYPAIYSIIGSGPYAASEVTKAIWAASKIGKLPYTQAVHQAEGFRSMVESVTHAFAAQLNRGVPEVPAASVSIRTQQEEASTTRNMVEEIREAAAHYRAELDAGRMTQAEYQLQMHELVEIAKEARWAKEAQGNAVIDSDHGNPATDEGRITTAIHAVSDLWAYQTRDILFAEADLVRAVHTFDKVDLPTESKVWQEWVLPRLAESWAARLEYTAEEERAREMKKTEYRAAVAEGGILANPLKARWAVNHIARRIWRDMQALEDRLLMIDERIDRTLEGMAREEKFNMPARLTRLLDAEPSHEDQDGNPRQVYLIWDVVKEEDFAPKAFSIYEEYEYEETKSGRMIGHTKRREQVRLSQGEYEVLTQQGIREYAEKLLSKMREAYDATRQVDLALAPVWQELHDPESGMPELPPVYWNQAGFYLTEEEAKVAYRKERDARREEMKAKTLAGIGGILQQMLEAQGFNA